MGKAKNTMGPACDKYKGYTVRHMTNSTTNEKKETVLVHNGKFGIYAGKKLVKEIGKSTEARLAIETIISEKTAK